MVQDISKSLLFTKIYSAAQAIGLQLQKDDTVIKISRDLYTWVIKLLLLLHYDKWSLTITLMNLAKKVVFVTF